MRRLTLAAICFCSALPAAAAESTCYGTVGKGKLENGIALPVHGKNFTTFSRLASGIRRTHVHSKVSAIVVEAYQALEKSAPDKTFVYGETGWPSGGRIRPHRTHQNGLSVDFMVPVLDRSGRSVALPGNVTNKFGYDIEFDKEGKYDEHVIDFVAIAEHLYALRVAAQKHGVTVSLVIFDPPFLPRLLATPRGRYLEQNIKFMQGHAWIRHDEHYHVDFGLPCKPLI